MVATSLSATSAQESFDPAPAVLESPLDDPAGAAVRLNVGSDGKTPCVKSLDPNWIRTLAERGPSTVYTRENSRDFAYIGMPVGGIGSGELYLGGDGRLWMWDIFNTRAQPRAVEQGLAYPKPHLAANPADKDQDVLDQGFVLRTTSRGVTSQRTLDRQGFSDVRFTGQYPIGYVHYADPGCPVQVRLEAFSPFVPGAVDDSSYPATILNYTLTNGSSEPVACDFAGWLENAAAIRSRGTLDVELQNTVTKGDGFTTLNCGAVDLPEPPARPAIVYDDFESGTYDKWSVTGDAFGARPAQGGMAAARTAARGFQGNYLVNGCLDGNAKAAGKMTSQPFPIERKFITFLIGGGNDAGSECVRLLVDGKVVQSATGENSETLRAVDWNVKPWAGKTGQIEIVDTYSGSGYWNHLLVDNFVFCDAYEGQPALADVPDGGTLALTLVGGESAGTVGSAQLPDGPSADGALKPSPAPSAHLRVTPATPKLVGALGRSVTLAPGAKVTLSYLVTWHFPNPINLGLRTSNRRLYGARFQSAQDVAAHLVADLDRLSQATRMWHDTWYDSTLPGWFLDRTFLNASTLASSTAYRMSDGRFYAFEGGYSCPGNCTHVWSYQPMLGLLFPELEKTTMEQVEFNPGLGMDAAGGILMRAEFESNVPVDGQAGVILRAYLTDRMSADHTFLTKHYGAVKKATDWLIHTNDPHGTGILEGDQKNTMDAGWYGKITWLSLYYQAALQATARMADEMGDKDYAASLRAIAGKGRGQVEQKLFNGEFFFQEADPAHTDAPGTYAGCHIDQLMGQNWAYATGLGQVLDPAQTTKALDAIWKYNFTTDIGLYRKSFPAGRTYGVAGESGVVMCTFPSGGEDALKKGNPGFAAYMNEVWAGCEHQLAALMMWQGQVDKSLAVERAIDERYAAAKRNPWDECECGSHYSRSMSSYGVFTAACGFEYDGPAGYLAFAPRVDPADFKAAFTSAEGWGSFSQKHEGTGLQASVALRHGSLTLRTLALVLPAGNKAEATVLSVAGRPVQTSARQDGSRLIIEFPTALRLEAGQSLEVSVR